MCFSFWGVPRGDSRITNQSATWLVNLRGVSISPGNTPKAKTHSVANLTKYYFLLKSIRKTGQFFHSNIFLSKCIGLIVKNIFSNSSRHFFACFKPDNIVLIRPKNHYHKNEIVLFLSLINRKKCGISIIRKIIN